MLLLLEAAAGGRRLLRAPLGVLVLHVHNEDLGLHLELEAAGPDGERLRCFVAAISSKPAAHSEWF